MIELRRTDPRYPERLRASTHAPDRLWVRGTLPPDAKPVVAIVGTRRMTDHGRRVARELSSSLARSGVVIVSGLAQGVDSTAHAAAVAVGGRTVAVLGEGLLAFDAGGPIQRRRIAQAILDRGAVVSEYPLDVRGAEWTFPRRNATIVGLSDAVVVVEAPRSSGALITAEFAREQGRTLFAVPGPSGAWSWEGSNALIARGDALFLTGAEQVASRVGVGLAPSRAAPCPSLPAARVLDALAFGAADTDTIASAVGVPPEALTTVIAELLIGGSIVATGDGRFARR